LQGKENDKGRRAAKNFQATTKKGGEEKRDRGLVFWGLTRMTSERKTTTTLEEENREEVEISPKTATTLKTALGKNTPGKT